MSQDELSKKIIEKYQEDERMMIRFLPNGVRIIILMLFSYMNKLIRTKEKMKRLKKRWKKFFLKKKPLIFQMRW